jgi:hypothetical protein
MLNSLCFKHLQKKSQLVVQISCLKEALLGCQHVPVLWTNSSYGTLLKYLRELILNFTTTAISVSTFLLIKFSCSSSPVLIRPFYHWLSVQSFVKFKVKVGSLYGPASLLIAKYALCINQRDKFSSFMTQFVNRWFYSSYCLQCHTFPFGRSENHSF